MTFYFILGFISALDFSAILADLLQCNPLYSQELYCISVNIENLLNQIQNCLMHETKDALTLSYELLDQVKVAQKYAKNMLDAATTPEAYALAQYTLTNINLILVKVTLLHHEILFLQNVTIPPLETAVDFTRFLQGYMGEISFCQLAIPEINQSIFMNRSYLINVLNKTLIKEAALYHAHYIFLAYEFRHIGFLLKYMHFLKKPIISMIPQRLNYFYTLFKQIWTKFV